MKRLTAKQEHFAQLVALEGCNYSDAYRRAYNAENCSPSTIWEEANELAGHPQVSPRIDQLREHKLRAMSWSRERFIAEAETNMDMARDQGDISPANAALKLIGQATGTIQPQTAVQVTNNVLTAISSTDLEQLAALAAQSREAQGLPDPILATLQEPSPQPALPADGSQIAG